jgi:hypothetical protein
MIKEGADIRLNISAAVVVAKARTRSLRKLLKALVLYIKTKRTVLWMERHATEFTFEELIAKRQREALILKLLQDAEVVDSKGGYLETAASLFNMLRQRDALYLAALRQLGTEIDCKQQSYLERSERGHSDVRTVPGSDGEGRFYKNTYELEQENRARWYE